MFLCRVRKSLKGQAFCIRYSRSGPSSAHKHNLCKVGRWLRRVCACASNQKDSKTLHAKKQLLLGDEREE
jgi:hypothetical protein